MNIQDQKLDDTVRKTTLLEGKQIIFSLMLYSRQYAAESYFFQMAR